MAADAHRGRELTQEEVGPDAVATPDMVQCPECGVPAEIEWSDMLFSTDGPVEHAKIRCANRHWFLMPTERLYRI
jgi:hypothetical protein